MFATARCFQVLPAAVIMAISVTPMAEARHWRYHGYFGYYGYHGQDRGVGQDRSRELSPGWSRNDPSIGQLKSFGSSIEQMIRSCEKQSVELKKTPFDSVSRTIRPNADQRAALDQIQHAAFESADTLAATCPQGVPPGLNEKFDTLINAINAMAVSRSTLHPAMVNFYSLLDEEQRARLVVHSLPNDQTNFDRNSRRHDTFGP
jgi:hypothetical protein